MKYKNLMETLVLEKVDDVLKTFDCCRCDKCRNDIIALALNQLPPKYVVTREGELYARLSELSNEQECQVVTALAKAIRVVKDNPKHEE